jgi:hypothetical protein
MASAQKHRFATEEDIARERRELEAIGGTFSGITQHRADGATCDGDHRPAGGHYGRREDMDRVCQVPLLRNHDQLAVVVILIQTTSTTPPNLTGSAFIYCHLVERGAVRSSEFSHARSGVAERTGLW